MAERRRFFRLPWRSSRQIRTDIDTELAFHIDERTDALIALGHHPDSARAQALREFGDMDDARGYLDAVDRDIETAQRRSDIVNDLLHDIAYSFRKLRASPAFTIAAVVTLALGIGANTAIFSVVNSVLLKPLPFPAPERLVRIRFTQQGHGDASTPMDLVDYRTQAKNFDGFATMEGATANIALENADAERVQGVRVSANWFDLLRAKPLLGRFFLPGEDETGARNVVVLSEQLWRRDFNADTSIVGKPVRINANTFTVVGVVRGEQRYPVSAELWMPKIFPGDDLSDASRGARWLGLLARVKNGVAFDAANAEATRISAAMEKRFPEEFRERRADIVTAQDLLVGDMKKPLYIILGAVTLVLLIACANVANLLLVRATGREAEMAIRTALGAGRGRLVRQLMTESVLLAAIGGVLGVVVAKAGMVKLLAHAPQSLVLVENSSIDATTLVITGLISLATGLLFGALPAIQSTASDLASTLRAGGRGTRNRPGANRTKQAIVVGELALAVMLLSGAGLMLRSFAQLMAVDPGFKPQGVLSMKVSLPPSKYDSTGQRTFVTSMGQRVAAMPGVKSVAFANFVPLDGASYNFSFTIRGRTFARSSDEPTAEMREVSPAFFSTLGIPVVRGREFLPSDIPSSPRVLVVNQAFANKFFPGENALGQAIRIGWGRDAKDAMSEIVGVVGDVHSGGLGDQPEPTIYASIDQYPYSNVTILAKTSGTTAQLAVPIRAAVRELDRDIPIFSVQTMEERVESSVGRQRFYATIIGVFAVVALVLAAVGLYGVIAYAVSQRTHELGVRVALGATTDRISAMVIGEGLRLTLVGAAVGIAGAIATGQLLSSLLFGVSPRDPVTLAGVVVVLAGITALASWLPARRAARVDPLVAMRGD